ncbi:hypothetical protein L226DRAFT_276325 [Lentinus tigrinus ALCF2SS1-7]|uniref:Uncharacterized protein n=1 Tax=Lentinus tigrinus ALCF2SS1-6 TaxID=1328759 RepID=A0A5C2RS23_9APHY|nr:hypothetical protein L227DRAFT_347431 [Lentinus tigrinus ALCF2SS1-6]RPD69351.1 hypothetical protein L226DRAFT_276325 [Lentinus tigrinus ALCF2SS1-7]
MTTSFTGPRCTCGEQLAHPRPSIVSRSISLVTNLWSSKAKFAHAVKSAVELGKTVVLPAIGFKREEKKVTLLSRIQAMIDQARTQGVVAVWQSWRAKPPPPPSPFRLLASAFFLPYGLWTLYKIFARDGDPNPELWRRRVKCNCGQCTCDRRCSCACRRLTHGTPRRILTFVTSSTFVDCCFASGLLAAGIAFKEPWDIVGALWDVWYIAKSVRANYGKGLVDGSKQSEVELTTFQRH